jgi:DNA-binding winged helix-turn-helix (wHTH) protein
MREALFVYRLGAHELDEALFELRWRGVRVALGPKPFTLLVHLVRNRHRVVTTSELKEVGWPLQKVVDARALRQTIHEIRRALKDGKSAPARIRSCPGYGYQWIGAVEVARQVSGRLMPAPLPEPDVA